MDSQEKILLVDDAPINLQMLHQLLHGRGFALRTAKNGEDALRIARKDRPDLILLDIVMPGMDGFETCRLLKEDAETRHSAVIFMSSLQEVDSKIKGLEVGAVDYITKPFESAEVLARVNTHITMRRLQRHLAEQNEELEKARDAALAATQAKSRFLASMTHELRTPLNVIIGYSEMLMAEAGDRGESALVDDLERIRTAGKDLLNLINDILDLSKVEAGKMEVVAEPFAAQDLLRELSEMAVPLLQPNGNQWVWQASDLGYPTMDRLKLKQILLNLISNACKFTRQGTVELSARRENDELHVAVRDTGIGMTEEQQKNVFEEFVQADSSTTANYGGTGLGLTIVARLVELLEGTITLESQPNVGTTFHLHFPRAYGRPQVQV